MGVPKTRKAILGVVKGEREGSQVKEAGSLSSQKERREAGRGKKAKVISEETLRSNRSQPQSPNKTSDHFHLVLKCQRFRRQLETTDSH